MLALAVLLGGMASGPALAKDGGHGRHLGWRHHEGRDHRWRERHASFEHRGAPFFFGPPAVFVPPPPVVVAPPVVPPPPGINLVFPLTLR